MDNEKIDKYDELARSIWVGINEGTKSHKEALEELGAAWRDMAYADRTEAMRRINNRLRKMAERDEKTPTQFDARNGEPYERPEGTKPTMIIAASILQDGRVWTGRRHGDMTRRVKDSTGNTVRRDEQGFWTDDQRHIMRKAAEAIARGNGQIAKDAKLKGNFLSSEDLW